MAAHTKLLNLIKPKLAFIRKVLYKSIKKVSFYILNKLDQEFEVNVISANIQRNTEQSNDFSGLGDETQPSLIINTGEVIVSQELLDFYLSGIFLKSELLLYVKQNLLLDTKGMSLDEVDRSLEKIIIQNFNDKKDIFAAELSKSYYEHKLSTNANSKAYSTENRLNPDAVFWPNPNVNRSLYTELPFAKPVPLIDKATKIVSAGSCFATEIAHSLQKNGYNYLVKEQNKEKAGGFEYLDSTELPNSSAAWGIIFNTSSFRQLVEKAFGVRKLPRVLWTQKSNNKLRYLDPFRENIAFDSVESYEKNYDLHLAATREALLEMDVFIITLGLNEVWYFKSDGSVFSRSPWRVAPELVAHKLLSVEENVADLVRMTEILRTYNPNVSIICTLSPVPLHATFRADDNHVVTANTHSKAVLRVAAEEFARRCKNVYYFPSYEVVTVSTQNPWAVDQRHVTREAVDNVMKLFHQTFSK